MDRPFAYMFDKYYEWCLNTTNPKGENFENLTHFPIFVHMPFGMKWNLNWYSELAEKTGLGTDEEIMQVSKAKHVPASYSTYNNEYDNIRVISDGAVILPQNLSRVENYKDLVYREATCLDYCKTKPKDDDFREEFNTCEKLCVQPRSLLHEDVNAQMENWRTQAVNCLAKHSLDSGDGDEGKFNSCLQTYADQLITYGTSKENLNVWASNYAKFFTTENFQKKHK